MPTPRVTPLPFIGGPLDGTIREVAAGRYPMYFDASGKRMDPDTGDRFMANRGRVKGLYVLRRASGRGRPQDYFWLTRGQAVTS